MVPVPPLVAAVQEVHWDPGLPVSRLYYQLPAVWSWVAVALTIRHSLRSSTGLDVASISVDAAFAALVGVPVPPTSPVATGVCFASTIRRQPAAILDPLQTPVSMQLPESEESATFVQPMSLSVGLLIQSVGVPVAPTALV